MTEGNLYCCASMYGSKKKKVSFQSNKTVKQRWQKNFKIYFCGFFLINLFSSFFLNVHYYLFSKFSATVMAAYCATILAPSYFLLVSTCSEDANCSTPCSSSSGNVLENCIIFPCSHVRMVEWSTHLSSPPKAFWR